MWPELAQLKADFDQALASAGTDPQRLEEVRIRFAGRKSGALRLLEEQLKRLPKEEKPTFGKELNQLKAYIEEQLAVALAQVRQARGVGEQVDVTLPGRKPALGALHPVTLVRREIEDIFLRMGYSVADGPEVEDDWHNFEALNIPPDHPARDTQDTFYLPGGLLLRTHTSPVQIRTMEAFRPPIRVIIPGRVYRRDSDLRHSPMFHQVEGLVVDEGVSFAHLKATLEAFVHRLFDPSLQVRLRPSFFPFTEPSAEVDITCVLCRGGGCGVCSGSGWVEILGAGMVDPRVFRAVGIDPVRYTGFAFGLGLDRVAMLKYRIPDLRLLFSGDERLLRQFPGGLAR
ncbi:MAG: phenylalanine--tRNA ligase subunit alpha [Thermoanaerobaculum sp.]|nr:phenylalanine--tRNA ligase subunit alpha [Thermoanaerobaculum sp.]MDW7967002.1 phenylalanine--tRNA ligase subunit alpha [Thermoanaerobaculum sp.]